MQTGSLDRRDYALLDRSTLARPVLARRPSTRHVEKGELFHADLDAVAAELARAVAGASDYSGAYVAAELAAKQFKGWDAATLSDLVDEAVNAVF